MFQPALALNVQLPEQQSALVVQWVDAAPQLAWQRLLPSRQPLHAGVTQRPLVQVCPLLHATHELPLLPHALVLVPAGEGHARI